MMEETIFEMLIPEPDAYNFTGERILKYSGHPSGYKAGTRWWMRFDYTGEQICAVDETGFSGVKSGTLSGQKEACQIMLTFS